MNNTNRILSSILALLVLLAGVVGLLGIANQQASLTRGRVDATVSDTLLPFRTAQVGVNVELTQYNPTQLDTQLDAIAAQNINWVRQIFPWEVIEPTANVYNWAQWDAIVEAVAAHDGLQLVAALETTPDWARPTDAAGTNTAPPADMAEFARFARTFAERYGDQIDIYQLWDEPNLTAGWGGLKPRAADYVALLQAGYDAIHTQDDTATVLTAGLAPTTEQGPDNYSDLSYLHAIYENGGGDYFDAVAGKPYGFDSGPDDRRVDENVLNFSRLILLREEMVRQGDAEKPLWGTQFGWNALPDGWSGEPSPWGQQTRSQQLAFVQQAYTRAAAEWPWAGGLILQHWQPDAPADDPLWGFSLIPAGSERADLPETLFTAGANETAAANGRFHPTTPYAVYTGEWELGTLGADFGQQGDSEVTFTFAGTALALEVRRDDYRAYLYASVDGQPANALPVDNDGQSYLVLTSDDLQPHTDIIPVAQNLSAGVHTLHLRADRGWDQWALAAFRVGTPPDTTGLTLLAVLAVIAIFGGTAAFVRFASPWQLPDMLAGLWQRLSELSQIITGFVVSLLVMIGMALTWNGAVPELMRRDPQGVLLGLLASGALYFSPSLVLTIISGGLLWLLIFWRIELGLLLTLFWAPYFLFPVELYRYSFPMVEVCLLLTATAWVAQQILNGAAHKQPGVQGPSLRARIGSLTALDWGMVALLVAGVLAMTWSQHTQVAARELRTLFVEPFLFYTLVRTTIHSRQGILRLVLALLTAAVLAASISLVMYISDQGVITAEGGTRRLAGVYGSPNNMGLLIDRALPFAIALLLICKRLWWRILALVASGILLLAAILSQSAGALLLGIPAGGVVVFFLWNRRYALMATGAAVIGGGLLLIPLSKSPRFARLIDFSGGTSFFRLKLWQSATHMIQDNPLTGVGLDQFLYAYRGHYILPEAWQEPNLSHPHNILLDFWTRLGLLGLFVLVWVQITFWRACWRLYRVMPHNDLLYAVLVGAMGSMAAVLAHGLVDNSVFVLDLSYVFALLVALPGLLNRVAEPGSPAPLA